MKTRTISSTVLVLDAETVAKIVKMEMLAKSAFTLLDELNIDNPDFKKLTNAVSEISYFMSELSTAILPTPERIS